MISDNDNPPVIFFDGVCNLCNSTIRFIIRHDKKKLFLFAPLQSVAGKEALQKINRDERIAPDSVLLFYKGRYLFKSDAALTILSQLGGAWKMISGFKIVPRFLRDFVYGVISRNRYKWFGKKDQCMIPAPELLGRFLS